jgi:hypothetical protein
MAGGMLLLACPQDFCPGRPFSPGTTESGTTIFHSAGTAGGPGYGTGTAGGATGTTAGPPTARPYFTAPPGGATRGTGLGRAHHGTATGSGSATDAG